LNVVDAFSLDGHKTKAFSQALTGLGLSRKILVVDHRTTQSSACRTQSERCEFDSVFATPYQVLTQRMSFFQRLQFAIEEVLKK
jgi:hypothetical protein